MKFVRFTQGMKSNDATLWEFSMLFFHDYLVKKELEKPMIYDYHGHYIYLTPKENDILGVGLVFSDRDYNFMYIKRKKVLELFDQLEYFSKNESLPIYLIQNGEHFEFTNIFPNKYALFVNRCGNYELIKCDDQDLKLLAKFLSYYKKSDMHENFLKDKRILVEKIDWNIGDLKLDSLDPEIEIIDSKTNKIRIQKKDLKNLMTEWQELLKKDPEKIYLLLENGEYHLTTDYTPE